MTTVQMGAIIQRAQGRGKMCETHLSEGLDEHVATISITDPTALVTLAREAPVLAAREAQIAMRTLDTGFNEHRASIIGAGYASAYYMVRTEGAWERFIKDSGWDDLSNRPKNNLRARNHMLLHVLRYVFRAEGEAARRRVRVYAGMLQDRYYKGFKPEGVIPLIKSRGIEALRDEGVALRKATRAGAKDSYFDDLNAIDDQDPTSPAFLPKSRWRGLTSTEVGKALVLLTTFEAAMLRYLTEQAGPRPQPRSRGPSQV